MSEEIPTFEDFIIDIANLEHDDYNKLSELPENAKKVLLSNSKLPRLDPWNLLDQAQIEQRRLEKEIESLKQKLYIAERAYSDLLQNSVKEIRDVQQKLSIMEQPNELVKEIERLINRYSRENNSNTPDFILAEYMMKCLEAFEQASKQRENWYGVPLSIGMKKP